MNLGELYIQISVDTSGIDSLKAKFEDAARSAESAASRMDSDFAGAGEAAGSVDGISSALENAVLKGGLLKDAMESAFNTIIDLAGKAANAIGGLIEDSVNQFADYEQNLDSMRATFGDYADDFMSWMEENSSTIGMSMNQLMEHANESGIILQKANAERRAQEQAGEEESTEFQKAQIDEQLANFKSGLSARERELSQAQSNEYESWKQYYAGKYQELKDELDAEMQATKDANDEIYESTRDSLQKSLDNYRKTLDKKYQKRKDALDKERDDLKNSLADQLSDLKSSLDKQYQATKDTLDGQVSAQRKANEKAVREKQSSVDKQYRAAKSALDAEVTAFNKATDARIREINREYTERYKLIDEQKYAELKALQDQIDALDAQDKAVTQAEQERTDAQKIAELERQVQTARTNAGRKKAEEELAAYMLTVQQRKEKQQREDQKDALKQQMDDVKDHYAELKSELKEQQSEEIAQYKENRSDELTALKASNAETLAEMKEAGKNEVQAYKDKLAEQLEQQKKGNADILRELKESNSKEVEQMRRHNSEVLEEQKSADEEELREYREKLDAKYDRRKESNEKELSQLKKSIADQEKEMKSSHDQRLKEEKSFQDEQLRSLKQSQSDELRQLKDHNAALLREETRAANERKKAIKTAYGATEITNEDIESSMMSLITMFNAAADVGAARNKDAEYVMSIFESMNYGRFATFDNLGLGYANKSGIQQMVADMSQLAGRELDPSNFNDVVEALGLLVDKYGMTGRAAEEAEKTISGSLKAVKADWENFMLALATEDTQDEQALLDRLFGTADQEGSVQRLVENVLPVVTRVISAIAQVIVEHGPEIVESVKTAVLDALPPEVQQKIEDFKTRFEQIVQIVEGVAVALGAFAVAGGIVDVVNLFEKLGGLFGPGSALANAASFLSANVFGPAAAEASLLGAGLAEGLITPLDLLIGLIQTPIAGVAIFAGMIANSEKLRDLIAQVAGYIGGALMDVFSALSPILETIGGLWERLNEFLGWVGDKIAQVLGPIISHFVEAVGPSWHHIMETLHDIFKAVGDIILNVADTLGNIFGPAIDALMKLLEPVFGFIGDFLGGVGAALLVFLDGVLTVIKGILEWLANLSKDIKEFSKGVTEFFEGVKKEIDEFFKNPGKWLYDKGMEIINGLKKGIEDAFNGVREWFSDPLENARKGLCEAFGVHSPSTVMMAIGEDTVRGYKEGLDNKWPDVSGFFGGIKGAVDGFFDGAGNWLTNTGSDLIRGFDGAVNSAWRGVGDFFGGRERDIESNFNGSDDWLTSSGRDIMRGLDSGINDVWDSVSSMLGGLMDKISGMFSGADWLLNSAGGDIMLGFYNGLVDAWNDYVTGFITDIATWIANNKGPKQYDLNLLVDNGRWIMQGFERGLRSQFPAIQEAIGEVTDMMDIDPSYGVSEALNGMGTMDGVGYNVMNVYVDKMSVRNDDDIYRVSQELNGLWTREIAGSLV